jgi:hypothetical protein
MHRAFDAVFVAEDLLAFDVILFPGELDVAPPEITLAVRAAVPVGIPAAFAVFSIGSIVCAVSWNAVARL